MSNLWQFKWKFKEHNITTTNYGAINLTWNIVNDAEKYMIYRNTSDFTITDESLWIANTTNNYYQDINTLSGVEYWYKIIAVDNVGNYNYSNASLSQNITSYDIITPRVPTSVNVTQNGNVATISWSEVLYDVEGNPDSFGLTYQIWVGNSINTSKNQINETLFFLKNVSENNSTTYSITSSDKYYFVVTTIDDGYNANLSFSNNNTANVSLTYTPPSNPSTGTPSSSGGGTVGGSNIPNPISSVVNEQNYYVGYVNQINANTPTDFKIDKTDIGVNLVTITLEKNKNNIGLEIKKINKPANIIKPTLKAYQFLEINLKNLDEVDSIKSVVFEFEVNNSWLLSESIDKYGVALLRYVNNTWVELETELISTDLLKTAYIGKSSGFSYFAIVGKEVKEELISSEINITDSYNESNINSESDEYIYEDTELDKEKIISHSMYNSYYLLFIFVIICVGIIIYFYFNKKVKKVK